VLAQWCAFRRASDPQWWVRPVTYWVQLERQQAARRGAEAMLVIPDCSPGLLANAVAAQAGYLVRVHRPALAGQATQRTAPDALAAAEQLAAAHADIINDGSLPDLTAEVTRVVRRLQQRERHAGRRGPDGTLLPACK
jgi:hypothetical protein